MAEMVESASDGKETTMYLRIAKALLQIGMIVIGFIAENNRRR